MQIDISSFVATPVLWRVLIAAAVVGVRLGLDELMPRGHVVRRTQWTAGRR
jgi:hypothetical protein